MTSLRPSSDMTHKTMDFHRMLWPQQVSFSKILIGLLSVCHIRSQNLQIPEITTLSMKGREASQKSMIPVAELTMIKTKKLP